MSDIESRPYANEHAARLRDPDDFAWIKQLWTKEADGIRALGGKLKGKSGTDDPVVEQAIRFKADKWTAAEAKQWLRDHDYKWILFEPATGSDSARSTRMATIERRFTADHKLATETRDGDKPVIFGYAARFYDGTPETEFELWADTVERIMPTAFDKALAEDDVRALFNHAVDHILGRTAAKTLTLGKDDLGLRYEIDVPATQLGRDLALSVKRGDITGSSFSFITTDEEWRKEGGKNIREIKGVRLFDVGPVTFPAYESTTSAVRSASEPDSSARQSFGAWQAGENERDETARTLAATVNARIAGVQAQARAAELGA